MHGKHSAIPQRSIPAMKSLLRFPSAPNEGIMRNIVLALNLKAPYSPSLPIVTKVHWEVTALRFPIIFRDSTSATNRVAEDGRALGDIHRARDARIRQRRSAKSEPRIATIDVWPENEMRMLQTGKAWTIRTLLTYVGQPPCRGMSTRPLK